MNLNPLLLLEKLVQYPSITPKECGMYEFVLEILTQALGEGAFELSRKKKGVKNLLFIRHIKQMSIYVLLGILMSCHRVRLE